MLSLWANWLQLNSQLNSPGVFFLAVPYMLCKPRGALGPHFGRPCTLYVPQQSEKLGAPERLGREIAGFWNGLEREMGVSGADL